MKYEDIATQIRQIECLPKEEGRRTISVAEIVELLEYMKTIMDDPDRRFLLGLSK